MLHRDPDNRGLLDYLTAAGRDPRLVTAPGEGLRDPYLEAGSHPDVVARVWEELGAELPPEARCLVLGTPALVRAATGTVLAVALGTTYALRVPASRWDEALALGVRQVHLYTAGAVTLDVGERFGPDWVFGLWVEAEAEWCKESYGDAP
jgi:hypothetical protein